MALFGVTHEEIRLEEARTRKAHWQRWGPYLAERAWGTVREDYSPYGNAWESLPHDHARARSHLERTPLRPDGQRRQSRRGREGAVFLSRQYAHALVHEISLQVSAGR